MDPITGLMMASAGTNILGGVLGSKEKREARRGQRAFDMWKLQQMKPLISAGKEAVGQYQENLANMPTYENALATLMLDPAYQFAQQQAAEATQGSAAARNMLLSGRAQQALQDRAMNIGSTMAGDVYNRQMGEFQTRQTGLANLMQGGMGALQGTQPQFLQMSTGRPEMIQGVTSGLQGLMGNMALQSMLKPQSLTMPSSPYSVSNIGNANAFVSGITDPNINSINMGF